MPRTWFVGAGFLAVLLVGVLAVPALAESGEFVELGVRGEASAINDRGQVVGTQRASWDPEPEVAFLWERGSVTLLGDLGGGTSSATDINNGGMVVGSSATADGGTHAFLWKDNRMTDLGTLGGAHSSASAVNNRGQVVGVSDTADGERQAFLWQRGKMTPLPSLDTGHVSVADVNNAGQIVGNVRSSGRWYAFIWDKGGVELLTVSDHVSSQTEATAINDRGDVLGYGSEGNGGGWGSVVWPRGGDHQWVPTAHGYDARGSDINNNGTVVGTILDETSGAGAFSWDSRGGDLPAVLHNPVPSAGPPFAYQESAAHAVNNRGAVVGTVALPIDDSNLIDLEQRMVLWEPSGSGLVLRSGKTGCLRGPTGQYPRFLTAEGSARVGGERCSPPQPEVVSVSRGAGQ